MSELDMSKRDLAARSGIAGAIAGGLVGAAIFGQDGAEGIIWILACALAGAAAFGVLGFLVGREK